jgi:hypothetical protein
VQCCRSAETRVGIALPRLGFALENCTMHLDAPHTSDRKAEHPNVLQTVMVILEQHSLPCSPRS